MFVCIAINEKSRTEMKRLKKRNSKADTEINLKALLVFINNITADTSYLLG